MARAMWKGVVTFGDVTLPVKLYAAVESGRGVHFRLLHAADGVPVRQEMIDPDTGEPVESEEVHKAAPTDDGRLVMLSDQELSAIEPERSRDIEILRFVDPDLIDHRWYERPYYLGPDGDDGTYAALAAALEERGREGVARWVMRNKEYHGALRAADGYLMLVTLRSAREVVTLEGVKVSRDVDKKELAMAEQLVSALEGEFDPAAYRDEYRERVMELIEARESGKQVPLEQPKRRRASGDLSGALRRSLAAAREKKVA